MAGLNAYAGGQQKGGGNDPLAIAAAEHGILLQTLRYAVDAPPLDSLAAAKKLGISVRKLRQAMQRVGKKVDG